MEISSHVITKMVPKTFVTVLIDGIEFDYYELYDLLLDWKLSDIHILEPMASKLRDIGVMKGSGGSGNVGAAKGSNFDEVYKALMELEPD